MRCEGGSEERGWENRSKSGNGSGDRNCDGNGDGDSN